MSPHSILLGYEPSCSQCIYIVYATLLCHLLAALTTTLLLQFSFYFQMTLILLKIVSKFKSSDAGNFITIYCYNLHIPYQLLLLVFHEFNFILNVHMLQKQYIDSIGSICGFYWKYPSQLGMRRMVILEGQQRPINQMQHTEFVSNLNQDMQLECFHAEPYNLQSFIIYLLAYCHNPNKWFPSCGHLWSSCKQISSFGCLPERLHSSSAIQVLFYF